MEEEKIKAVKLWTELPWIRGIEVFIAFSNCYWRFIEGFNALSAPLTLMLRINLAGTLSHTNVRKSIGPGNDGIDDGEEVGEV